MTDTTPQDRAVVALNEKFGCANGAIGIGPSDLRYLTATKSTGLGLMDWQKLTLGEIVDCLADAGLLVDPAKAETQNLSHALLLKGCRGFADQVDAMARLIRERDQQHALAMDTLGAIWLYVGWRYVSKQLTTEQKELWADAVDAFGDPDHPGPKAERWWRDDFVDGGRG